jgi:hypothetical protein
MDYQECFLLPQAVDREIENLKGLCPEHEGIEFAELFPSLIVMSPLQNITA